MAAALVSAAPVEGATRTWDGGGADNNWSTPANWSADTLPIATDTVTFNGTSSKPATIDVPVTVAVFQMSAGYTGTVTQSSAFTLTTSFTQAAGTFIGGGAAINVTGTTTVSSGGTFNGGSSPINLTGALTVKAGGTFTSTNGTLTVTGTVTLAAGVFTHNGGTVVLSTSNVTLNLAGAATFNNVQFLSGTKTFSAANTMTVLGTLTLAGGTVNAGTIAAQGDISVAATFLGGSTTLLINGGGPQAWSDAYAPTADLPVVNINKPGGSLTMTGTFRTTRNWTWTAGAVSAAGSTVVFAAGLTVTGSHALGAVELAGGTVTVAAGTTLTATGALTLTSGTMASGTLAAQGDIITTAGFTGGSGTFLINGAADQLWNAAGSTTSDLPVVNINKPGGTLTMTGTLRTTHHWTWTAGTMAASGSTVIFAGQTITGSHTLGSVELRGGTVTIAAGTTVTATGSVTLTSGLLNTGTLAARGDITAASGFTGGSGTLLIDGGVAQTWTGAAITTSDLPVVNINKPAGTLSMTGTFRTTRNWTWTAGSMAVSGSTVTFAAGLTITGSHSLDSVEIRGGNVAIAAGTTLTATGSVNLFSGNLNTGTLAAQGDIASASGFGGGTGTLLVNGAAGQTWTGAAITTSDLPVVSINKPGGTLTLTGALRTTHNWTWTAGAMAAGSSTMVFAGGSITGSHTLATVEIRGTVTIAAGTTLTVSGPLSLISGALNTGTLAAQGNIDAQLGYANGGTATLLISGTGAQTLTGFHTSAAGSMPNVDINKSSGTLTVAGTIRSARNWTYSAGGLAAAGSSLIFNGTQTIAGSHTLDMVEVRGGTLTIAAGTTLSATGSVMLFSGSLAGTGTLAAGASIDVQSGFTGGVAPLLINGNGPQTLSQTSIASSSLPAVNIAKPSGTLTMTGTFRTVRNWTYTSGGLAASGGPIQFAGTMTITGTHVLDAVEIAGTVTIAAGTTVTAAGTLTLTSGSLSTGTLAAQGGITATAGFTGGGTGTLLIDGSGTQTITGLHSTAAGSLPNVDIAKSSGVLTVAGTLRTARNWTYTSGGLTATGSTVIFNGTQTITGSHALDSVDIRGALTIAAGTTLTVDGPLNLFSGSVNTGTLSAQGNVDAQIGFTGGGTGTLQINGSGAQILRGFQTPAAGSLPNLDFAKPSGVLTIVGTLRAGHNWTHTSGGLAAAGSTVVFNGTLTVSGNQSLDAVELRSGAVTVSPGDTLTVDGLLTLTDGNLNGGTVEALGDIVLQSGFDGETGTIRIGGSTDQTFSGAANSSTDVPNIVIDKPSGTLHLTGTIRMTTSSWTWLQGTVDPGASTVTFDAGSAINGTQSLFNVYLAGGAHTVAGGDILTALGTLTLDNGTIDGGTIAAAGPITQLSTFDGGSGLLAVTGSADRAFTGSATTAAGTLPDLQISTSGGTLDLVGTIRTIKDWSHLAGAVDPTGSTVVLAGTSSVDAGAMSFDNLLVNAGTATLLDNLTVAGHLTVAAGTLVIGSYTAFVAGDVTVDAGLTATSGRLDMNGLAGQVLGGAAAIGLFDLTVNDPTGVTQAATLSVAGTLDLGGPLHCSAPSLTIANPIAGVPNNLTLDATCALTIGGGASGIVIPASVTTISSLAITDPSGATLSGPLTVLGTLTLAGGNIDTGGNVLTIGPAGSMSRTSGHVVGPLEKTVPLGSAVGLTFEIGDATAYAPVVLVFDTVSSSGTITASTTAGEHASIGGSLLDSSQDVNRSWSLANLGVDFGTLAANFNFAPGDIDPGSLPARFVVAKWDGAWTMPALGGRTGTSITATGMTSLSSFAVGEASADLAANGSASAASILLGGSVQVNLAVENNGPADATNVGMTVTLPPGSSVGNITSSQGSCLVLVNLVSCNLGALANGSSATIAFDDTPIAPGAASFNTSVTAYQSDPAAGNDGDGLLVAVLPVGAAAPLPTESQAGVGSLPDSALPIWTPGGIGAIPFVISAWIALLLALAFGTLRGRRAGR